MKPKYKTIVRIDGQIAKVGNGGKHGMHATPIYLLWKGMKDRCSHHEDYTKLGIKVCDKWLRFEGFYEDMATGYKSGLSIDRIDNLKGYSKDNCRWATKAEQQANKRNVRLYKYHGKIMTLGQWSKILGIKRDTLDRRILRKGWSIQEAFEIKPHLNNKNLRKKWDGHTSDDVLKRLKTL